MQAASMPRGRGAASWLPPTQCWHCRPTCHSCSAPTLHPAAVERHPPCVPPTNTPLPPQCALAAAGLGARGAAAARGVPGHRRHVGHHAAHRRRQRPLPGAPQNVQRGPERSGGGARQAAGARGPHRHGSHLHAVQGAGVGCGGGVAGGGSRGAGAGVRAPGRQVPGGAAEQSADQACTRTSWHAALPLQQPQPLRCAGGVAAAAATAPLPAARSRPRLQTGWRGCCTASGGSQTTTTR